VADTAKNLSDEVSYDPKFIAGVEMVGRTGSESFHISYDDRDEHVPTFWVAIAEHGTSKGPHHTLGAGFDPLSAVMKLCSALVDGGKCRCCHKTTAFDEDFTGPNFGEQLLCWYKYDPELKTFRRSCEGDNEPPTQEGEKQ
jgi:hypothetical protein